MAGVNSTSVVGLKPAAAVPQAAASSPAKRVQVAPKDRAAEGRRAALLGLAAVFAVTATTGSAKAGIIDEYLEKSKANKVSFFLVRIVSELLLVSRSESEN
jgi:photosystem I subunit PsaN